MSGSWSFRPAWWAVLGTLAGCVLTAWLGVWQLHRGEAKQALQDRYAEAGAQAAVKLAADAQAQPGQIIAAQVQGQYLSEHQLLLDNQTHERQPGYDVWTPVRLHSGGLLLVNRGWVPGGEARGTPAAPSAPAGEMTLQGLWRSLPEPGLRMAAPACAPARSFPAIVNYPTAQELACLLGEPVAAGEFLLDPKQPDGFVREWNLVSEFPPQRHYAYAAQWFTFALTLFAIFIKINLKKSND